MIKPQFSAPHQLALAVSSFVVSMGITANAQAQGMALEEVIVTAQKRMESSQETPVSITPLSADSIEKRGIVNSADLIGEVPGVGGFSAPGSRGTSGLSMRGVSAGSPANVSLDPAIALYMDGVYVGKLVGSSMDVAEIERMEVLRGPQGTLYGRNSTAGAVNIVTKKPTGEFGVRATVTAGNYDLWGLKANVDLPGIGEVGEGPGRFAASLGYQVRKRDGLYSNTSGQDDFDELDRQAWRFALNWMPTDSVSVDYIYDHSELDEQGALQQVVGFTPLDPSGTDRLATLRGVLLGAQFGAFGADPRIASRWVPSLQRTIADYEAALARGEGRASRGASDASPLSDNENDGHALTISWEAGELGALGDVSFKSITAYRDLETYVFGDLEDIDSRLDANGVGSYGDLVHLTLAQLYGLEQSFGLPSGTLANSVWDGVDTIGAFHSRQDTTTYYEQYSQEFQMIGATERLDYVLGLYYFEDESEYDRRAIFAAPLTGAPIQQYEMSTEAFAAFGQGTWRPPVLDDRLSITAGLRYTEETKDITYDYKTVATPFGVAPAQFAEREENFYNLSGTLTVGYQFTEDFNAFVRYATGYRSGGFNGEIFDNPFDEETIEQWEIGLKTDWWDRRLRVNGSLYTYTFEDIQVSQIEVTPTGATTTSIVNAGEADRWGGELEILVAPIEDLVLGLSYAYIHGDFEKFPQLCNADASMCINTDNLAKRGASPSNQLNFTADYTFARTSFGDFTGYLQVNWQDEWIESSLWSGVVGVNAATGNPGAPIVYPHQGMDERTVVNARLNLENVKVGDGTLKFSLWGKNLTDDDYPNFSINFGSLGLVTEQYGEPRTYGLDVSYEY